MACCLCVFVFVRVRVCVCVCVWLLTISRRRSMHVMMSPPCEYHVDFRSIGANEAARDPHDQEREEFQQRPGVGGRSSTVAHTEEIVVANFTAEIRVTQIVEERGKHRTGE